MTTDRSEKLGIIVYVEDQATGKLTKVKAEVAGLGPAGAAAGRGLATGASSIERSSGRISGALTHARGAIGGLLTGPLGLLGLGAGVLSIGGAFSTGLSKAQTWGLQIEKLQGITHNTAEQLSGLLAVTEKYGLSDERLAQIAGFTQKALGNLEKGVTDTGLALAGTTGPSDAVLKAQERLRVATIRLTEVEGKRKASLSSLVSAQNSVKDAQRALDKALASGGASVGGADKFLKDYGFDIRDSSGKVKDFTTLLLTFSDYWNGNTNQGLKAAAAAKLFGRGYADLVPVMNLGSKGIRAAEEEAKALGLTLTQDNVVALSKAREATRQWGDALGGLELQLGLALLPKLTELATWATSFVSQHGHELIKFFTDAADFAGSAAGTIGNLAGAAAAFWGGIPKPLQDLLVTGLVADRTVHFLFGFSPIGSLLSGIERPIVSAIGSALGGTVLGKLAGGLFSRGSSPANPLYVTGAGIGNALTNGGTSLGLLGGLLTATAIIGIAELVGPPIRDWAIANGLAGSGSSAGKTDSQLAYERAHQAAPPPAAGPFHDSAEQHAADTVAGALVQFRAEERSDWAASIEATRALNATMRNAPWLSKLEESWRKAGQTMHDKIKAAIAGLSGPHAGAAAAFLGSKLGNAGFGAGGYDQAEKVLALLRAMKQSPEVVAAIHQLEGRLKRLKLDRDDLAAAEKIAQSADPKNKKLDELNALMADLKAHGDRTAQKKLQDVINAVKHQKLHTTNNLKVPITAYTTVYVSPDERPGRNRTSVSGTALVQATQSAREYSRGGRFAPGFRLVHGPELQVDDRSGYIFNAARTNDVMRAAGAIAGGGAAGLAATGSGSAEARIERLLAAVEALASRPVNVNASARDMERAQLRRASYGPTRSRQLAIAP